MTRTLFYKNNYTILVQKVNTTCVGNTTSVTSNIGQRPFPVETFGILGVVFRETNGAAVFTRSPPWLFSGTDI
jgi:hypothetical protein